MILKYTSKNMGQKKSILIIDETKREVTTMPKEGVSLYEYILQYPREYWGLWVTISIIILLIVGVVVYFTKYYEGFSIEDWQRQYYRKLYHQPWYMYAPPSPTGRIPGLTSIIQKNEDYLRQPYDLYNPALGGPSMQYPFPFPSVKRESKKREGFGDYISGANIVLTPEQIKYLKSKGMTDVQIISLIMKGG